jgi:hypothetical protein
MCPVSLIRLSSSPCLPTLPSVYPFRELVAEHPLLHSDSAGPAAAGDDHGHALEDQGSDPGKRIRRRPVMPPARREWGTATGDQSSVISYQD